MRNLLMAALAATALTGCTGAEDAADNAGTTIANAAEDAGQAIANGVEEVGNAIDSPEVAAANGWAGRWIGVEGTYLEITKAAANGRYRLEMQYTLDDKGIFDGTATPEGIAFTRPDGSFTLRATDGATTGLKYLDGKKTCLTVKEGEGYCRD